MRHFVTYACVILGAIAAVLQFYGFIFMSNERLYAIAQWQIVPFLLTTTVLMLLLVPLSAFRPIRPMIQPGFAIAATLLFLCLVCVCPVYLQHTWGSFWVFVGFVFMIFGCVPLSVLAALFSGDWLMLFLLLSCLGMLALSFYRASVTLDDAAETHRPGGQEAPRAAIDASNAIWILLVFLLPYGLYSHGKPFWLWLIPVGMTLAVCLRKGHRWAHVSFLALACAYFWLLVVSPEKLTALPELRTLEPSNDINRYVNSFAEIFMVILRINGGIQHAVVAYVTGLLLMPTVMRWFWSGSPSTVAAIPRCADQAIPSDGQGEIPPSRPE